MSINVRADRLRSWQVVTLVAVCLFLVVAPFGQQAAQAVDRTIVANGAWTTPGDWAPPAVPVSGDSVQINYLVGNTLSVAGSQAFGDAGTDSNWDAGTIRFSDAATLTQTAGRMITTSGGDHQLQGPTGVGTRATYVNQGTFENQANLDRLYYGIDFRNSGTYEFTESGSRLHYLSNATQHPSFINLPGGDIRVDLPVATNVATIDAQSTGEGTFINNGNPITFVQGRLAFAPPSTGTTTLDDALVANLFGARPAGTQLGIGGRSFDTITATGLTAATNAGLHGLVVPAGESLTINVPSGIDFNPLNGAANVLNIGAGSVVTNEGLLTKPAGLDALMQGPTAVGPRATFNNEGTFDLDAGLQRLYYGVDFRNSGNFNFTESASRLHFLSTATTAKPVFTNLAGGTVTVDLPASGNIASIDNQAAANGPYTFENFGTVDILSGIFRPHASVTVPSISAGSIDQGTWRILADANSATFDFLPQPASSLTTIGANAQLVMSEQGAGTAAFPQLGPLSNVDGGFFVHGTASHTVDAGGLDVTGTVGGDGTITGDVNLLGGTVAPSQLNDPHGILSIGGDLTMDSSSMLAIDISGNTPGVDLDFISVQGGNAFLDGMLLVNQAAGTTGPFDILSVDPGFFIDGIGMLAVKGGDGLQARLLGDSGTGFTLQLFRPPLAPEPATWALLGMALSGLGAFEFRRRRRA